MTSSIPVGLDRYRDIIPEWDEFLAACRRPLAVDLRVNTLRIRPEELRARLENQGIPLGRFDWEPTYFRTTQPVGATVEHWAGLYYLQEIVQSVPVAALDPRPGELVLDLCAAPGGKTTDIAARMENRGCLIANEPNGRRQQALLANVNRIGAWNTTVAEYRGQDFPLGDGFDRVLVDAPCSAEGTLRKEPSLQAGASAPAIRRLAGIQAMLILRGFDLLRVGGWLVYSTCTFAPEENEAIVAHLLERRQARILPLSVPFPHACAVTAWDGVRYPKEVAGCLRIYPHHLDSGGGFVARIERVA
ncbi:MAG: NOL1/NOP2/sun family putative RNA methylase [Candidatus Bipolaricaulis sp.]|nr:NOL1/NOP2/sun family putative RNA methylase [Candidatus Bipolaricaulis sp.]MDD5219647.1 NOL1/NOP2/sun family putative RNA methylase [Candidatus Bipolaricaulis sp.]MDD5646177.1 NOL1/NOP2/sun family putative RNA methylase [Candidatus Bipolaricaulis sp.]